MEKTLQKLKRANSLVQALGRVSAQVAKVSTPIQVLDTLRTSISTLGFNFVFISIDENRENSTLEYASFDPRILKPLEKVAGKSMIGFTIPRSEWPPIIDHVKPEYPLFVDTFMDSIRPAYSQFPNSLVDLGLKTVGIDSSDSGIIIPLIFSDKTSGMLITWGKNLIEEDLPAFSIFGSQIGSSLEQAKLIESEQKQVSVLERSNALILALGNLAARASTSFVPEEVLDTLAVELKRMNMDYYLCILDQDQNDAEISYVSPDSRILNQIEKIFDDPIIGFKLPRDVWPEGAKQALNAKSGVYVENFYQDAMSLFNRFPQKMAALGLDLIGINQTTHGIHIARELNNGTTAVLTIWGPSITETDLATFSIYSSQIISAFEQARLIKAEQEQSKNLIRSNTTLEALSAVTAKVATSENPDLVLKTLGEELQNIGIDCIIVLRDKATNEGSIRYHSINSKFIKQIDKISNISFSQVRQSIEKWPPEVRDIFETNQPIFVRNFLDLIRGFIGDNLPDNIAYRTTSIIGLDHDSRGVFLPLTTSNQVFGCLALWDKQLNEKDLSTLSVFSNQVAIAFESARLLEAERDQAQDLQKSNAQLKALSRIASRLSSSADHPELVSILEEELKSINLDFAFISVLNENEKAVVEHISLDSKILNMIRKRTNITVKGGEIPQSYYPQDGVQSFRNKETIFIKELKDYLFSTFQAVPKKFISKAMDFAGINEASSAMLLPIQLGDGSAFLIIIWGDSLRESNLSAFRVYATQVESKLETSRLYKLAQQEISDRKIIQEALSNSQKEYRGLFENAHDAIIISDLVSGRVLDVNERSTEMYGYTQAEFVNMHMDDFSGEPVQWTDIISKISETKDQFNFNITQYHRNGHKKMQIEVNAGIVVFNNRLAIQSVHRDVTKRNQLEDKLRHDSLHDSLTGLPNRTLFHNRLDHVISICKRENKYPFAVLFVDLDHFKGANDTLGHIAGDHILVDISNNLQKIMRSSDTLARFGGDEFVILAENIKSPHDVIGLCERILENVAEPIIHDNQGLQLSASIGVVIGNPDYTTAEDYIRDADIAMYRAKANGRNRYDLFDIGMRTTILERVELEYDLRTAVSKREFHLVYQPIFKLNSTRISGLETLIRWDHHQDAIPPKIFIPIAEEMGIINAIGSWVLEEACAQFKIWKVYGDFFDLHVNISPIQLLRPDFPSEVKYILQEKNLNPEQLVLEITETAYIHDQDLASQQIIALKQLGVKICLDDFGTGFSSLNFLTQLPIDTLKIDKRFIVGLNQDKEAGIINAILALGTSLKLDVIAEGIETEEQCEFLKSAGCQRGQGFHLSKCLDSKKAGVYLKNILN